MKIINNSIIKKLLITLLLIVLISNFIMPSYVQAGGFLTEVGINLANAFFDLLRFIGDLFLKIMQKAMVGTWEIENFSGTNSTIQYSPGIIFSNQVAGLKVNFVGAKDKDNVEIKNNLAILGTQSELRKTLVKIYNAEREEEKIANWTMKSEWGNGEYLDKDKGIDIPVDKIKIEYNSNFDYDSLILVKPIMYAKYSGGELDHRRGQLGFSVVPKKSESNNWTLICDDDDWYCGSWEGENRYSASYFNKTKDFKENDSGKNSDGIYIFDTFVGGGNSYKVTENGTTYTKYPLSADFWIYDGYLYVTYSYRWNKDKEYFCDLQLSKYNIENLGLVDSITNKSVAKELQSTIAKWYVALRTIALVGLLSVLVYLGIRIILSSTSAQDKAKYKNMLKDWIVALCILFVLHYIMSFMLSITQSLNGIMVDNVIGTTTDGNNYDKLMSEVRDSIGTSKLDASKGVGEQFGYVLMYLALVILTGIFTFQYLKRVVFMAFLTMIAPLIALTYPIDKVKDGKAQAFSYWLKEYIFNCLIQPVHLLLYTVLICSAFDFAKQNILYSIVALAFMVPAEKFIKEMFGLKSSSPTGQLGAAAGGAMVMSMLNKIKSKPPKDAEGNGGSGGSKGVRTANNRGTSGSGGSGSSGSSSGSSSSHGSSGSSGSGGPRSSTVSSGSSGSGSSSITGSSRVGRGNVLRGVNAISSGTGKLTRKAGGALLGATTGAIALAANIADGDIFDNPTKAMTEIGATAAVGYAAGNNFVGNRLNNVKSLKTKMDKSQLGLEEYNNRQFDMQFYKSDDYKMIAQDEAVQKICKDNGVSVKAATQTFLNNGITDGSKIREALKNGIGGEEYSIYNKAGIDSVDKMHKLAEQGITAEIYKDVYKSQGLDDASKIASIKKKNPNYKDSTIAYAMAIAKEAPSKSKEQFISWARVKYGMEDNEAEKMYKKIMNFF